MRVGKVGKTDTFTEQEMEILNKTLRKQNFCGKKQVQISLTGMLQYICYNMAYYMSRQTLI